MLILFLSISTLTFSQNYGEIKYMNRSIKINTAFFERLHSEYERKLNNGSINYKYQKIYYDLVDVLKLSTTTFKVDEAKRISWIGVSSVDFPYCDNKELCSASAGDKNRASYLLYQILLPVIESTF
jgi:hypothetical protein